MVKILSSTSKKRPLGEVLVLISQQGPEILSSLHFVMLCLYLRGHSTFGGYFFTRWALLHRPFNIWWQLGQKCLFRGLASMEVGWPQSPETFKVCPRSVNMAKFWCWLVNRGLRYWAASILYHIEVRPQLRPWCQNPWKPLKCASKVPSWRNIDASQSTGSWVIERPPFYNVLSISQRPINFLRLFLHRLCTFL